MDLIVSPRANTSKSVLYKKQLQSGVPAKSHNLAYKHVGNDIYPVIQPKQHHLNYYADDVKVYYKRKVTRFDQTASTHILPGGEFLKSSTTNPLGVQQPKKIKIISSIKPMRSVAGADRKLFRTTFDPRALSNLKNFEIQDFNMMWADSTLQYSKGTGVGKSQHLNIIPIQRKNATTFQLT